MRLLPTLMMLVLSTMSATAADWVNLADPPKDKIVWPAEYKLKVEIPKCFFDPVVTFADHGGPFASLNVNFGQDIFRMFVDLQKGTVIGKTEGNITGVAPFALSRSGKRFAASLKTSSVAIIEPTTGKVLKEIECSSKPESMQFASDTRLAAIKSDGVEVYDTDTGKLIMKRNLKDSHRGAGRSVTSPGGKYLFARDDMRISVFDIETDKLVTDFSTMKLDDVFFSLDCMAVSPDGLKLAVLAEAHRDNKLQIRDLTTGKVTFEGSLGRAADYFYNPKLTWAADSSSLFFGGSAIVDIENGKEIFVLPPGQRTQRIAITNRAVVVLDGERNNRFLGTKGVSSEQINTAKEAVKTGGVAADALLPPLAKFDLSLAKVVEVPLVAGAYSAKPDPAPMTVVPDRPIAFDFSTVGLRSMLISSGPKASALLEFAVDGSKPGKVRQVDLSTGRTTRSFDLPAGHMITGLSPDGSAFTAWHRGIMTRTDFFPIKGEPIGLRPFGNEANEEAKKVVLSEFISPTQLLTVNPKGKLILWSVPKMTPIYVAEVPGLTAASLSPGGKYLGGVQNGIVRLIDTQTGNVIGDLKPSFIPQNGNFAKFVSFRPDGEELLSSFQHPTKGAMLVRWDLKTGNLVKEHLFPSSFVGQPNMHYLGNNHVMVNFNWIYDFKHSAYVWRFNGPQSYLAWYKPDDRVWYATDTAEANGVLVASKFPDEATIKQIDEIVDGPGALIKVGSKVAMKYKITGSMAAEFKPMITSNLRKNWTARGLVAATEVNADLTVGLIVGERDTGKIIQFSRGSGFGFGFDRGENVENVKIYELTATSQVFVGKEKIWESATDRYLSASGRMHISMPNGETDITHHLGKLMWQNAIPWAENSALPRFLAKTADGMKVLPETSFLGSNGLEFSSKK